VVAAEVRWLDQWIGCAIKLTTREQGFPDAANEGTGKTKVSTSNAEENYSTLSVSTT